MIWKKNKIILDLNIKKLKISQRWVLMCKLSNKKNSEDNFGVFNLIVF